jgi:hypothetical protein
MLSKRRKGTIVCESFIHNIYTTLNDAKKFRCQQMKCMRRLFTNMENEYTRENPHSHEPDNNKACSLSIRHAFK